MGILQMLHNRPKVLGINERNLLYIRKFNKRKARLIADDKLLSKTVLNDAGIPTPKLLTVISNLDELRKFDWNSLPNSFVIKPVTGLEGGGIDIFYNRDKNGCWIRADRTKVDVDEIKKLAQQIIEGNYSLHQQQDRVMIEERVKTHMSFKYYTYKGAPDIRVIVFNHIPLMSYVRLPTRESAGKANLALGALGVGIDLASGTTTTGIHGKSGAIEYIPGTKLRVSGLKIPYWDRILRYAIEAQKATGLNFAAVDFLMDRDLGPLIVELNARPGLSIQLANSDGLRWRLKKAAGINVKTTEKGVRLAKDLFGGEIEEEIAVISGKEVVGLYENIKLIGRDMQEVQVKAKIDTGADSTSIDTALALKLGFKDILDAVEAKNIPTEFTREEGLTLMKQLAEELTPQFPDLVDINFIKSSHGSSLRPSVRVVLKMRDTQIETTATVFDRSKLSYPVIIGRKSLKKFLVDPSKLSG